MTDLQCRDKIAGALSVSMMPLEQEAECLRFLDRCMQRRWRNADREVPKMHTEIFEDFDESTDYEVSHPVLAFTEDREIVVAKCCYDECGKPWWFNDDGTDYKVVAWQELPEDPKEVL